MQDFSTIKKERQTKKQKQRQKQRQNKIHITDTIYRLFLVTQIVAKSLLAKTKEITIKQKYYNASKLALNYRGRL